MGVAFIVAADVSSRHGVLGHRSGAFSHHGWGTMGVAMHRVCTGILALVISVALAADLPLFSSYPTEPGQALAAYSRVREALNPASGVGKGPAPAPSDYSGKALELSGELAGRIAVNATDSTRASVIVRLKLGDGSTVCASSTSELSGLDDGEPVRAILDVTTTAGDPPRFRLRAIISEFDLPSVAPAPQPAAAGSASVTRPPSTARLTPGLSAPTHGSMALPPELRGQAPSVPGLAPFALGVVGNPRDGKEGAWDPVGNAGFPIVETTVLEPWKAWVRRQNSNLDDWQADWIVRWVTYYSGLYGVDHRLIFAMIKCESSFNPFAVSSAGAVGLTQLMPCNIVDYKVSNKWNVQEQIRAGVRHFRDMLDIWEGRSPYEQFALAAASYNAGPNRVKRDGGIPNIPETRNYVKKLGDLFYQLVKDGYP